MYQPTTRPPTDPLAACDVARLGDKAAGSRQMEISDQHIVIPRSAIQKQAAQLYVQLPPRPGLTYDDLEAALWSWLCNHVDEQLATLARLAQSDEHQGDLDTEISDTLAHGPRALAVT